jgi:hypothetical protein
LGCGFWRRHEIHGRDLSDERVMVGQNCRPIWCGKHRQLPAENFEIQGESRDPSQLVHGILRLVDGV